MALGEYVTVSDLKLRTGITDTTDDTLLGQICDEVNSWIESYTGRVLAPVASATYIFDGYDLSDPYTVDLGHLGAQAVTAVETSTDGSTWTAVDPSRYSVRPLASSRSLEGEPGSRIIMTDGYQLLGGYGNIRVTMTSGFSAVPDDVRAVAIAIAQRWWHARQTGMLDVIGMDETSIGQGAYTHSPVLIKTVPAEFKRTLDRYKRPLVA